MDGTGILGIPLLIVLWLAFNCICMFAIGTLIGRLFIQYVEKDLIRTSKYSFRKTGLIVILILLVSWIFVIAGGFRVNLELMNPWVVGLIHLHSLIMSIYRAVRIHFKKKKFSFSEERLLHEV